MELLIGLLGAVIGATASIATVWIQSSIQGKRDRLRLVIELALEDHKSRIELARASGQSFAAPPIALYLHYHLEVAKLMEEGQLTPERLEAVAKQNRAMYAVMGQMQDERNAAK